MAGTFNRLNCRPVVVISGDKCQQQPLQTVDGRVSSTISILNDTTFSEQNSVKHALYQQFRIVDRDYAAFVDLLRYLLCPTGFLDDDQLYGAFANTRDTVIMTISRAAAQRINNIVPQKLFAEQQPLTNVPCAAVAGGPDILPYRGVKIVITENRDKTSRIVNSQDATIVLNHGQTIIRS